jgi:hypothetical protein
MLVWGRKNHMKQNHEPFRLDTACWHSLRIIFLVAGLLILLSGILGIIFSPWYFLIAIVVSAMMINFSLTGFCPMAFIISRLGAKNICEK